MAEVTLEQARTFFPGIRVFIFGVEVTDDVSSLTITINDTRAPSVASITLVSPLDRYVLTEKDLETVFGGTIVLSDLELPVDRNTLVDEQEAETALLDSSPAAHRAAGTLIPYSAIGAQYSAYETAAASRDKLRTVGAEREREVARITRDRIETEILDDIKKLVLRKKMSGDDGLPFAQELLQPDISEHDAAAVTLAGILGLQGKALRYPLQVGDSIFHSNDPVRIFMREPRDPSRWYHMFAGYVSDTIDRTTADHETTVTLKIEDVSRRLRYARVATNPGVFDIQDLQQTEDFAYRTMFAGGFARKTIDEVLYTIIFGPIRAGTLRKDPEELSSLPKTRILRVGAYGDTDEPAYKDASVGGFNWDRSVTYLFGPEVDLPPRRNIIKKGGQQVTEVTSPEQANASPAVSTTDADFFTRDPYRGTGAGANKKPYFNFEPPANIAKFLDDAATRYDLPRSLVWGIGVVESAHNRVIVDSNGKERTTPYPWDPLSGTTKSGARGIMQIIPSTAKGLGLSVKNPDERLDPEKCIDAGAKYLSQLREIVRNKTGRSDDWEAVARSYHAGPTSTARWIANGRSWEGLTGIGRPRTDAVVAAENNEHAHRLMTMMQLRPGDAPPPQEHPKRNKVYGDYTGSAIGFGSPLDDKIIQLEDIADGGPQLAAYQARIDHEVKVSDIVDMVVNISDKRVQALETYNDTDSPPTISDTIKLIGEHPELYPVEGRLVILSPSSLGPTIDKNHVQKDIVGPATLTEWKNRLGLIYDLAERIEHSFYASPKGDLIFEMPLYDFRPEDFGEGPEPVRFGERAVETDGGAFGLAVRDTVGPFGPAYIIPEYDVISQEKAFSDEKVVTQVVGVWSPARGYATTFGKSDAYAAQETVTSRALVPQFGVRAEKIDSKGVLDNPIAARMYANIILNRMNADARSANVQTLPRMLAFPNRPLLFEYRTYIATARQIQHSLVWGESMQTQYDVNYMRGWSGLYETVDGGRRRPLLEPLGGFASHPFNYALLSSTVNPSESTFTGEVSTNEEDNST